ncbi:ATP-binding protein [Sphingobacterium siyangense]|uniref:sensor histidine kinase n=1 Tax=Sphingobacterium siyangense TaxID=459529 RepID=UPI002010BC24|nr:ATP-binding protein [Sphingobacterium siyangense]UQA77573.1 ATP-binding protein [Sphingobacterium siyangense]
MSDNNLKVDNLSFNVDAGLIDRLGRELVGRAETAVSELIKNAYDADATLVNVKYIDSNLIGGTLIIEDNGVGMTLDQLKKGFMTISSTDKIHNPRSIRFQRSKAGRKGIGRFATQRLGHKLIIITQTIDNDEAIKISIDWDDYKIDSQLNDIKNKVEYLPNFKTEGTTLIIENLRDSWSEADIKRVYRYVSDLLQPDYLSDKSQILGFAKQSEESFKVTFTQTLNNQERIIADTKSFLFDKALAIIEGYVDKSHDGYCSIESTSLDIDNDIILVPRKQDNPKFHHLSEVHFKAYYFIYNRDQYYSGISKMELASIQKISNEQGGIRLYRNGFRVLPYGEPNDDWLNIDRRYYNESGTNAPFGNRNLFGFVEIIDPKGILFEETASREGLIENESFRELSDFLHKALEVARNKIRYAVEKKKNENNRNENISNDNIQQKTTLEKLIDLKRNVEELTNFSNADKDIVENIKKDTQKIFDDLKGDFLKLIDELGMLRVLAGLGLTIGEFTHEVVQFTPSIMGDLSVLGAQNLNTVGINSLDNLKRTIQLFISYTSYFNSTVSENVSRELKVQSLDSVVSNFHKVIKSDLKNLNIEFNIEEYGFDLNAVPMHTSEWTSILFNLYTNSKKAIRRSKVRGSIKVVIGKEENKVYLEFSDNGDGIPNENKHRIFLPFFTTSSPVGFDAPEDEKVTGTGLGLKIVKDIIVGYGGTIELINPEEGFSTCFRIELPMATSKQIEKYGV